MNWVQKNIDLYLPRYLSETTKIGLLESIRQFPDNIDERFYLSRASSAIRTIIQGDGIGAMPFYHFPAQKAYQAPGIVISNSCDINPENERHTPINICYAPIMRLDKYYDQLIKQYKQAKADNIIYSIRKQEMTQYFYLPKAPTLNYEGIVFFDQITNIPNPPEQHSTMIKNRVFTLSQYGFYLFLFKLSIHFTRMGEGIDRGKTFNIEDKKFL
jgi:hypothetical protein